MSLSARNWAWAVREVHNRKIKPGEKLVLLCLAELENPSLGYAYPSQETISNWTGQSARTVREHLASLELCGTFSIEKRRSRNGRWLRNVYVLSVPEEFRETDPEWSREQSVGMH